MIVVRASVVQQPVSGARVAPTNDAGWPPPNRHDLQCSGHNAGVAAGRGRVPAEDLIEFVRIAWCGQTGLSVCGVRCAVCGVYSMTRRRLVTVVGPAGSSARARKAISRGGVGGQGTVRELHNSRAIHAQSLLRC